MCTSIPCSANSVRAAARMRSRLRRASDRCVTVVMVQAEFRFRIVSNRNRNSGSDYRPDTQEDRTMMTTAQEFERRRWIALVLLCLSQFIVVLDASIVNVALPSIGEALDFSQENLAWVVNAYVLTFGGFLLLGGRMADLLGRRLVFMTGLGVVAVASLAAGFANSEGQLIAARAAQGL